MGVKEIKSAWAAFFNYFFKNKVLKNSTIILLRGGGSDGPQPSFSWKWETGKHKPKRWVERSPKTGIYTDATTSKNLGNMKKKKKHTDWGPANPQSVSRGVSLSRINILKFYFQNSNWSLWCQHFSTTFPMSSVGIMNIFLTILVVFEYRRFRKNLYWLF